MTTDQLPPHPFTSARARQLGCRPAELREAVADGSLIRLLRGVYVRGDVELTALVRALAVQLVVCSASIICDRTAAWIWGVDCFLYAELDGTPLVESCVLRHHQATEREGVRGVVRDLLPVDSVLVAGVRVTTPLRTAADLGCRLWAPIGLGAMDALARAHGFGQPELQRLLPRYRRRRGVLQLRSLVDMLEPRAESQPESWVRWFILSAGLAPPVPQVWVQVEGRSYRLDLCYPRARILVEYDGEEFHDRTEEQRRHDETRRAALRRAGWIVIVVTRDGLSADGRDSWLGELREALRARGVRP